MRYWILFILLNLSSTVLSNTNDPYISLSRVTPDGGVSYSQVTSIIEDEQGRIWFGTNNGLFSYNANEIKRYSHIVKDTATISTNRINELYKDNLGILWVATENGLCSYNQKTDNFTRYNIRDQFDNFINKDISAFFQDDNGTYWFSDKKGFGTININTNRAFYKNIEDKPNAVSYFTMDENQIIWVIYNDGTIYYLPKGSNTFQYFTKSHIKSSIRSVIFDDNYMYIGYENKGLYCLNIKNGKIAHRFKKTNDSTGLPSNKVRNLLKDKDDRIWVATYEGIVIIENLTVKKNINKQKYSNLPNHSIWSLYQDSHDNVWIGTWMGGLAFHSNYNDAFIHYNKTSSEHSISDNIVSSFVETPDNKNVLIGTDAGDLNIFNPDTNVFKIKPIIYNNDTIKNIKSLAYDKNETLWVGTYGNGVLYQKKHDKEFHRLIIPFNSGLQASDLLTTDEGIWVSSYTLGAYFYHFKTKKVKRYLHNPLNISTISNNYVRNIIEDNKGDIWLATENGLNLIKKETSKIIHYFNQKNNPNSVSANYIYSIYQDKKQNIWIGTNGSGLDKLNPKTGEFKHYTLKEGLAGLEIFSITEDDNNNLWLTTENGLSKLNLDSNIIKSYTNNKGIQNNQFHPISSLATSNGEIYFGGSNGLIRFSPKEINTNPKAPKTTITRIYVNNKRMFPIITPNGLDESLKLNHQQNSISLEFISNNYINPKNNQFKYRLVGFNEDWIHAGFNGKANFINIPPNKYVFEVKAANNAGVWNEVATKISIDIAPPIWKRWYAYLLYLCLIIYASFFFRKQVIHREKLNSEIRLGKAQRENEDNLHKMKLQFFTNISHEFRTPLTLIQGPISRLLKSETHSETSKKQLILIKNNTDRLLRLINQFLDFRRADSGKLKINTIHSDLITLCENVFDSFEEHANYRSIDYHFNKEMPKLTMDFDHDKIDKVLVNILSNAFKNTSDSSSISLTIKQNQKSTYNSDWDQHTIGDDLVDEFVELSISDNGTGISPDKLPLIFQRFFQVEGNYNSGTGIGLSLSTNYITLHKGQLVVSTKENKGTTIYIYLPINQNNPLTVDTKKILIEKETNLSMEKPASNEVNEKNEDSIKNQNSLILIAEDNPELLDFLGDCLQDHFRVAKTKNGKEAYNQVHTLYPDLIVSDIMMPEINGIELCEKIKTDVRTSHIPIILLTALDTVKDKIAGIHSGADAYLGKPFDDELLVAQINNLLDSRKALRESYNGIQENFKENLDIHDLDKKLIIDAVRIVEQNLSNSEFTVEEFSKSLNFSRTHLHRKLKSITNESATEFIRNIRLKHAINLMKENKYIVKEIGYAVGFNSHNYFTKAFKKQYGKSPSDFIKENFNK